MNIQNQPSIWKEVKMEYSTLLAKVQVAQVFQIERNLTPQGKTTREIVYGLTSLSPPQASPGRLLTLVRDHWQIENGCHWRCDVTLGVDDCLRCTEQLCFGLRRFSPPA